MPAGRGSWLWEPEPLGGGWQLPQEWEGPGGKPQALPTVTQPPGLLRLDPSGWAEGKKAWSGAGEVPAPSTRSLIGAERVGFRLSG